MRPQRRVALAFVSLLLCTAVRGASAQTCRTPSDSSYDMVETVKYYALSTDSITKTVRDSLRIPAVASAANVVLINKAATCKSANTAYQAAAVGARATLSGKVHVVQVGTRYVVWDPSYSVVSGNPAWVYMVFDSNWVRLSTF